MHNLKMSTLLCPLLHWHIADAAPVVQDEWQPIEYTTTKKEHHVRQKSYEWGPCTAVCSALTIHIPSGSSTLTKPKNCHQPATQQPILSVRGHPTCNTRYHSSRDLNHQQQTLLSWLQGCEHVSEKVWCVSEFVQGGSSWVGWKSEEEGFVVTDI
jgi:hypothetical protein